MDTPFEFECDLEGGFAMHPGEHLRIGYVVSLDGFGLPPKALKPDLHVAVPYNNETLAFSGITLEAASAGPKRANVIGVIEKFEWNGGTGDPIKLEFGVSQENATQILSLQYAALKTTMVTSLGWWIADYDPEEKAWFEQSYALNGPLTGHINNRKDPDLSVDMTPIAVKEGIGVSVYKVKIEVVPAGDAKYKLHFATSHAQKVVRVWGILIGST
jgi:hypothetical protein